MAAAAGIGRLDILVNNASSFFRRRSVRLLPAVRVDLMDSNLKAPLFLRKRPRGLRARHGLIINMIDIHGLRPLASVYSSREAGLAMLTRALARKLGPEIRSTALRRARCGRRSTWRRSEREIIDKTALNATARRRHARTALFWRKTRRTSPVRSSRRRRPSIGGYRPRADARAS